VTAIFLPLGGGALIWALGWLHRDAARWIALAVSLATLGLAGWLVAGFQDWPAGYAVADWPWLADWGIDVRFSVGLDGLAVWLFGLSALLSVTSVLVSWEAIRERAAGFYALLLLLETGMLGVFAARDILLFYVFFEFTLIPLFFLIGIWGSEERRYAAIKFFLFTFAGSVLTFLGLLAIVFWDAHHAGNGRMTFSIPELTVHLASAEGRIDPALQMWIFAALFAGFAIKVPLFPLHTWLPLAHVQAPTAGSVLLAGILLKIGGYGFVRFSLPMLPEATAAAAPWVLWLSVAGIVYGALVALAQSDIKRLIAYSSVSHLGFAMLGIFALNRLGVQGGVLQMINHGLSTGGLFALVGMLYERYHTREVRALGGIARRMPRLAFALVLFTLASIGLPGLNGFASEFLLLAGMFQRAWGSAAMPGLGWQLQAISVAAVLGVVLGAWYMLWLVERTMFGPLKEPHHDADDPPPRDLSLREVLALAPLAAFIVWIGLAPQFFLERSARTLDDLAAAAEAQAAGGAVPVAGSGRPSPVEAHDALVLRSHSQGDTPLDE
jgi:NADH-quinone oxidoreductase subunit M